MFVNEDLRHTYPKDRMLEYDWRKMKKEFIESNTHSNRKENILYAEIKPSILGDAYIDVVFFGPEETCEVFGDRHSAQNNHNSYSDGYGGVCSWSGTIKVTEYESMKDEFKNLAYDPLLKTQEPTLFDRIKAFALKCKAEYEIKHIGESKAVEEFKQIVEGAILMHYGDKLPENMPLHFVEVDKSGFIGAVQIMIPQNGEQVLQTIGAWDYEAFINGDSDAFYIEPEDIAKVANAYEEFERSNEDIESDIDEDIETEID